MQGLTINVAAGRHERDHTPVSVALPEGSVSRDDVVELVDNTGSALPAQIDLRDRIPVVHAIIPSLDAGATTSCALRARAAPRAENDRGVAVRESPQGLTVELDGSILTTYHVRTTNGSRLARPFCFPVVGPGGHRLTRAFPMEPDAPGETRDHPHHRSLWVAYGEVNDVDNWSEAPNHGFTVHERFEHVVSGPVFGGFTAVSRWTDHAGAPLLRERRTMTFYQQPSVRRCFDVTVDWTCGDQPVTFGDTKEGGIFSTRVASSMDGKAGGTIRNSYGGLGESETWGRRAEWCDYSGVVDGAVVGIAVFDHPRNFRSPCYWHVRDYGLMTTNVFGGEAFTGEPALNGKYTLSPGSTLTFRYRAILHSGDAVQAKVADLYHDFVNPPRVSLA